MSVAVLVSTVPELAVGVAVATSGVFGTESCCVVVASLDPAAELRHPVLDTARRLASNDASLTVVDLNQVIAPFHPYRWGRRDLDPQQFAERWAAAGGLAAVSRIVVMSGEPLSAQPVLAHYLNATQLRTLWAPDGLTPWNLDGRELLGLRVPPLMALAALLARRRLHVLDRHQLDTAWDRLAAIDAGLGTSPWRRHGPLDWWRALASAAKATRPTSPEPSSSTAEDAAAASVAFVAQTISAQDARLGRPPGPQERG